MRRRSSSARTTAFLNTSTGAQAKRDKRAIAAAKDLPIETVQLSAGATEIEGNRATLRVEHVLHVRRHRHDVLKTSRMTAEKTPEGWRISNDRPSAGMLAPWEYTRYKARDEQALPGPRATQPQGRQA